MSTVLRAFALIVFTYIGFIGYAQSLGFLSKALFTAAKPFVYGSILLQGFFAAAFVAALLCYPIAWVFRRRAVLAAFAVSSPVLLLHLADFMDGPHWQPAVLFLSAYEIGAYALLLILGTRLARKRLSSGEREPEQRQN